MAAGGRALIAMVVLLGLLHNASARTYLVGQPSNGDSWTYVTGNQTSYDSQFNSTNLVVGDILSFVFNSQHNVYEIPPADVATCDFSNPISTHLASINITLATAGQHGFVCEVSDHCTNDGMHLLVTVAAGTSPSPAPASPSPTPATSPASAPATSPASAPATSPSSAPATSPSSSAPGTSPPAGPTPPPSPNASFKLKSMPAVLLGSLLAAVLVL